MKRVFLRIVALCLVVSLVFSGCGVVDFEGFFKRLTGMFGTVSFDTMEYVRPDLSGLESTLEDCLESAAAGDDFDELIGHVMTINSIYGDFYTNYLLAYIHYSIDLTDIYWEEEYNYCVEESTALDAAIDQMMYALADCPFREKLEHEDYFGEGYFDDYDGESLWTEEFTALMEQEAALLNEYYDISGQALATDMYSEEYYTTYGVQLEELFVELVSLRQQIAQEAGYGSYAEFAYEFYYYRDYTPAQASQYTADIQKELVPLYQELRNADIWTEYLQSSTEQQTFQYVKNMAAAMGGTVQEAFELMESAELYHISYGENKYNASFEVFLPNYMVPFIFMNPTQTSYDQLTFAHEFGHFCNDYASGGTMAGIDVAEIFSQGLEYLSLFYVEDTDGLEAMKMADSLCVYVEQSAYASFEEQVYSLSAEELTAENVRNIFGQTATAYGFGSILDSRSYVTVGHFFTSPMYIISYVVSNDAALQLYQKEKAEAGAGLSCYTGNLATEQSDFLAFLEEAGLESPFAPGRIQSVKETFEKTL